MTNTNIDSQTMAALFRNVAVRCSRREALVADNARLTYAELDARTDILAKALQSQGVNKDTTIATLLLDGLAMVELSIATAKLGATLLTVNWRLAPAEVKYILSNSSPQFCFVSDCFEELFKEAGGTDAYVIEAGNPQGALAPFNIEFDASAPAPDTPSVEVSRSDRWYMLYTSGTTGRPKGCMHSQGAYFINVLSWMHQLTINERDSVLIPFPLFHVNGFATLLCSLVAGAKVVIPPRGFSTEDSLRLIEKEEVTIQLVLGEAFDYLTLQPTLQLLLKLRMLIAPGGIFPKEGLEALANGLNVDMRCMYGQTESGCWISMLSLQDQLEHLKSCGKVMPHLATKIVDGNGEEVACGEVGELLIKGETITMGYLNLPEATASTIVDGWLHTGDLFYQDEDGFLYIAGREKELIKTGGENVYPAEVDSVLNSHPGIADACIVGVPDPRWQEAVKACVVVAPSATVTRDDIVAWCREHIAGYKRPRYIEFVDELPRDFNGKLQRKVLAERETSPDQAV